MSDTLLDIEHLKMHFPIQNGFLRRTTGAVKAVDDVSLKLWPGETVGLVGESGCGKTTLGRCLLRAYRPTEGRITYTRADRSQIDLVNCEPDELREARREIRMIFQDPFSSLNPRMTVRDIVANPLVIQKARKGPELDARVADLLRKVGLKPDHMRRYPHAFSGGQRQRIVIARALALNPRLVVGDEPVSALDVSVQAQVLNLLRELQEELALTYLFIAHDLSVVKHVSDRIAVMYVGKIVESARSEDLFSQPLHPYTEALLSAIPRMERRDRTDRIVLRGEVADPSSPPGGCYFHPRCPYAVDTCRTVEPPLRTLGDGRVVACHRAEELSLKGARKSV